MNNDDKFIFIEISKEKAVKAVIELRLNHSVVASLVTLLRDNAPHHQAEHLTKIVEELYERMSGNIGTLESYLTESTG